MTANSKMTYKMTYLNYCEDGSSQSELWVNQTELNKIEMTEKDLKEDK